MTPQQFDTELRAFVSRLLGPVLDDKTSIVKHQVISQRPLTVRVGMRCSGVDPEAIKAMVSDNQAFRKAWLAQWPVNNSGARDPRSVAIAGDDKHVLMDLIFFTLQLETPDSLTPADPEVATAN